MEAKKMGNFIEKSRKVFRSILEKNIGEETIKIFLHDNLEQLCSKFEEDVFIENLAEEYKEYLKELAA